MVRRYLAATEKLSQEEAAAGAGVSQSTLSNWRAKRLPTKLHSSVRRKMEAYLGNGSDQIVPDTLDAWGAARARAVEKLADLLLADQRVLEMRAEAALTTARAALIEAEKAPDRSLVLSSDREARLRALVDEALAARRQAEQAGGGPTNGKPARPDSPRPGGEG